MESTIDYTGNEKENYSLLLNKKVVAEIHLGEDQVNEMITAMNLDLFSSEYNNDPYYLNIQNDDDMLGVIIDVYLEGTEEEPVNSFTYWFESFYED